MAIKNYTSVVKPTDSLGKIQAILAEYGASRIQIEYTDQRKPKSVTFAMWIGGNEIAFQLSVDVAGLLQAMKEDSKVPSAHCNSEQAERTAWKNKLEWLQIQLAEIQANQARMEQLLLGYAVTRNGQTAYERLQQGENLLTASSPADEGGSRRESR